MVQAPDDFDPLVITIRDKPAVESTAIAVKIIVAFDNNFIFEGKTLSQTSYNRNLELWQFVTPKYLKRPSYTLRFNVTDWIQDDSSPSFEQQKESHGV